jgi:hypothetical protein
LIPPTTTQWSSTMSTFVLLLCNAFACLCAIT